ncbi:MAG: 2OG-Fe(II) oxygenase family protein [Myxococcota bacterium]
MSEPDDGVDATNRAMRRYEQVDKDQHYRLAERRGAEEFDDDAVIPRCDLGAWLGGDSAARREFADQLGAALREIGFAILVGTGVDPELYAEAERRTIALFSGLTDAQRTRFAARRHGSVNEGYFPLRTTSGVHPDLVEGWVFGRRAFRGQGHDVAVDAFWPTAADEAFFRTLLETHEAFIVPIMQAMLTALGQPDVHAFDERMAGTNVGLRLNYYPPIDADADASGAGRLLGHEDVTMFTMLPAPSIEGLQVLDRRTMRWIRLRAPAGSLILNTGDYMQRISNDHFRSTTHRVATPASAAVRARPRATFPLNVYLREREVLRVLPGLGAPKYEPIDAIVFHTRTTAKYYGDAYAVE